MSALDGMRRGSALFVDMGEFVDQLSLGLQPHRSEAFKLSNDPLLIDKVRHRRIGASCVAGAPCYFFNPASQLKTTVIGESLLV